MLSQQRYLPFGQVRTDVRTGIHILLSGGFHSSPQRRLVKISDLILTSLIPLCQILLILKALIGFRM